MNKLKNPAERSGMLGRYVAVRQVGTRTMVKSRPSYKRVSTPKQQEVQDKFLAAADWAKWKLRQPGQKDEYRSRTTTNMKSAYMVAIKDYLNAPVVKLIDANRYGGAIGDPITVHAVDDFRVARVEVEIRGTSGKLIERGEAVQSEEHNPQWTYITTIAQPIEPGIVIRAIAYDNPGNQGVMNTVIS